MTGKIVAISALGQPIGESSPNCRYSDAEIEMVIELRESGMPYRKISKKMDIPRSTVFAICHGLIRAKVVDKWVRR